MVDIIKQKFGEQLKSIRKSKGFTQEQLAEKIGINLRQLARIESGESFVTSDTIYKICLFLQISPKTLFDFELNNVIIENQSYKKILNKLCNISSDSKKLDFIDIALSSLYDKSYLEKLKLIIKGIELTL